MKRDLDTSKSLSCDLLVIGGGIYGAWIALYGSLAGLKTVLVEQNDWASATSQSSSKLIHGGLRYLQYGQLGLVRKALQERLTLLNMAPHLMRPVHFCIPMYPETPWSRHLLGLGLHCYDFLSPNDTRLPNHQRFLPTPLQQRYPSLKKENLKNSFLYSDIQTDDARYTLEIVRAAQEQDVLIANYARVGRLLTQKGHITGALIEDQLGGGTFEIESKLTVAATGPWNVPWPEQMKPMEFPLTHVKGSHIVLPDIGLRDAFLITGRDKRVVFAIPWYGHTLVGTTESLFNQAPESLQVSEEEKNYLLETLQDFFPSKISHMKIISSFAGLRTLYGSQEKNLSSLSRDWRIIKPCPGLLCSIGGKLTTARVEAFHTIKKITRLLTQTVSHPESQIQLSSSPKEAWKPWLERQITQGITLNLDPPIAEALPRRYGQYVRKIHELIRTHPDWGNPIVPELPFCLAEIPYSLKNEMAQNLTDVCRRRIPLFLLASPDSLRQAWPSIKEILTTMDWSKERIEKEESAFHV